MSLSFLINAFQLAQDNLSNIVQFTVRELKIIEGSIYAYIILSIQMLDFCLSYNLIVDYIYETFKEAFASFLVPKEDMGIQ